MIKELIELMQSQNNKLNELFELLKSQHNMIMNKDVFGLEGLVDKINECAKVVAKQEVERRNMIGEEKLSAFVRASGDNELKEIYINIQETVEKVQQQKETNVLLLKQQLLFTNKMLGYINPNREMKTYNSYGNLSR
jgi:flagellar biosynthesis/type III secretory pathway chaperone